MSIRALPFLYLQPDAAMTREWGMYNKQKRLKQWRLVDASAIRMPFMFDDMSRT